MAKRRIYAIRRSFYIERPPNPDPIWHCNRRPDPLPEMRFDREELIETTEKELRHDAAQYGPRLSRLKRCHYTVAHAFVRNGGFHSTGLYTDIDGRIRYAEDGI